MHRAQFVTSSTLVGTRSQERNHEFCFQFLENILGFHIFIYICLYLKMSEMIKMVLYITR